MRATSGTRLGGGNAGGVGEDIVGEAKVRVGTRAGSTAAGRARALPDATKGGPWGAAGRLWLAKRARGAQVLRGEGCCGRSARRRIFGTGVRGARSLRRLDGSVSGCSSWMCFAYMSVSCASRSLMEHTAVKAAAEFSFLSLSPTKYCRKAAPADLPPRLTNGSHTGCAAEADA